MRESIPVIRLRNRCGDLVARDGVILCFFMRRSHGEVVHSVWNALQTYGRAILPHSLGWYGSPDGDTLPLDEQGWEHIRKKMLERLGKDACNVELDELCGEASGYHFEYYGRRLDAPLFVHDEDSTSAVSFSFPTEYLLEHGPTHLRALALELARELPFSFGYASPAFVSPRGYWFEARQELADPLSRYLGMDLYRLDDTSRSIGTRARGAYWLTFLGQPLLGQLGGIEGLRPKLPFPDVSFESLKGERLLLTLGEWPDAIDTDKHPELPQYQALAHLLEPFFYEERTGWFSLDSGLFSRNKESFHRWLRRLCQ